MISVKTYIKSNNEFVEFNHYEEAFEDSDYIEGAGKDHVTLFFCTK